MITHKTQALPFIAGEDLRGKEGYFVGVSSNKEGKVTPATTGIPLSMVLGLLDSTAQEGEQITVLLPGFSGVAKARIHASSISESVLSKLQLAPDGSLKAPDTAPNGIIVAVALQSVTPGALIDVRLVEPYVNSSNS